MLFMYVETAGPTWKKNMAAEEAHFVEMEKGNRKAKWYERKI